MTHLTRRALLIGAAALAFASPAIAKPAMTVHKSPSCGCCGAWIKHVEKAGYTVSVVNADDLAPVKAKAGVPDELMSCHTAFVDGYVVEGHVPSEAIDRLLSLRPAVRGIAVAGMPDNSPGMPAPRPEPFAVMTIPRTGKPEVFLDYPKGYGAS